MKIINCYKWIGLLLMCAWSCCSNAQDSNFHIFLAFGQSNMEGMGKPEVQDRVMDNRIKVLQDFSCSNLGRTYGQWYTATPPLFGCWGNLGIADHFAKTLLKSLPANATIGIVPTAVGGSDIALFQKSAPIGKGKSGPEKVPSQFSGGYAWLLDLAKKAQKVGVIEGIIFHQGETNSGDPQWKYKVQEIVKDLRKDLNLGDVPFLAGELLYQNVGGCCAHHNPEIAKLPSIINNAHVISAEGLQGADVAHFNSASYREFGRRYGAKMATLIGKSLPVDNGCGFDNGTPICCDANSDPDGDGWGWEQEKSCLVSTKDPLDAGCGVTDNYPNCCAVGSDPDGDGWGWENEKSCLVVKANNSSALSSSSSSRPVSSSSLSSSLSASVSSSVSSRSVSSAVASSSVANPVASSSVSGNASSSSSSANAEVIQLGSMSWSFLILLILGRLLISIKPKKVVKV